jgi:hypothetical protein
MLNYAEKGNSIRHLATNTFKKKGNAHLSAFPPLKK